jgi:uncharacterized tellurite resistance protein B-like protein
MALNDRIIPLCDLLLGAAYADDDFKDREEAEVRGLLEDLCGGELTVELETRIAGFDPKTFDFAAAASAFVKDPADDKKRVLFLVAAINDADEEIDFAEDEYLRKLCTALALPDDSLVGMTVDVEVEEMRDVFEQVRKGPPPPPVPGKKSVDDSFDIDL